MQCFLSAPVWTRPRSRAKWRCGAPAPRIEAARTRLLDVLSTVPLSGASQGEVANVETCIDQLLQHRSAPPGSDDLTGEKGAWSERLHGRWNLAFTTEKPLRNVLGLVGDVEEGAVYQLLDSGKLQNVISTAAAALVVDGEYEGVVEEGIRRCPFTFRGTRLLTGGAVARFRGGDAKGGIDVRVGFAIGKGCFQVLWLDHSLRIDLDTSKGDGEWINVYYYAGPVVPCRVK